MGEDVVESQGLEADHYVQRPVEPEDFLEFVLEIERLWFAIVQDHDRTIDTAVTREELC